VSAESEREASSRRRGAWAFAIASTDPTARTRLERFCTALSAQLGNVVYPQVERGYGELTARLSAGSVDLVWAPPLLAAHAIGKLGAVPVACLKRGGTGVYHSAFVARKDKGLSDLASLRGKVVAYVDERSSAGYVVPRRWLAKTHGDPDAFFSRSIMAKTHEGVVARVLAGEADVGATYAVLEAGTHRILDAAWLHASGHEKELTMVGTAGTVPADAIVASRRIAGAMLQEIARALSALGKSHPDVLLDLFHSDAFVAPPHGYTSSLHDLEGMKP
jgi:phosphonate transport system substrate-binding protein